MASSLPFIEIEIDENEVAGAQLPYPEIEKNRKVHLERFLSCRKLLTKGRKSELVARVKEAIQTKVRVNPYVDGGVWIAKKEKEKRGVLLDKLNNSERPPNWPIFWNKFPTKLIPQNFSYGNIYSYLISSCRLQSENLSSDDEDDCNNNCDWDTGKPFKKGGRLVDSDYIKNLEDSTIKNFYCLRAIVFASYKKDFYQTMIMLNEMGDVVDANCNCKGSSMGRCCHIAALLLYLDDFNLKNKVASTSQLCQWNTGRKQNDPGPVYKRYKAKVDPSEKIAFDPRKIVPTEAECKEKVANFLLEMQLHNSASKTDTPSMWELILTPEYEDYILEHERKDVLMTLVSQMKENLKFAASHPKSITMSQTDDEKWLIYRKLLMTASVIKEFHLQKTNSQMYNLLERHLYNTAQTKKVAAMDYGHKYEKKAREHYVLYEGDNLVVEECGLWINPMYPGLGASPDGLVVDGSVEDSFGLLEIKCPQILEYSKPTDLSTLTEAQVKRFCCELCNGRLLLKKEHKYYYQVQIQMSVTERKWCDFVIWTKKGIHVERIFADSNLFQNIVQGAFLFYDNVFLLEYFEQRVPRKLTPFNLQC